jgi:hypothetical protein
MAISNFSQRRLIKVPQVPSVWEGDRRPLAGLSVELDPELEENGDCIIWIDGSEGFVRAMEIVSPEMGAEAIVRTLIKAIESPHRPAQPARPQKIIVRDRELQFFLRGALQNLDIVVEYAPQLPLIDELFRGFESMAGIPSHALPSPYRNLLNKVARQIWEKEPWDVLADHDILEVELNQWGVEKIYVCVMGMLGEEYGVLLYRCLDSLKRFRNCITDNDSFEELESAFLAQDCWFLNFESLEEDEDDEDEYIGYLSFSEIQTIFGSVHPYEGMRPFLDEEEALAVYVALQAFLKFFGQHEKILEKENYDLVKKSYQIKVKGEGITEQSLSVSVSTLPDLVKEFIDVIKESEEDLDGVEKLSIALKDDLIPDESFLSLGMMPWEILGYLKQDPKIHYQPLNITEKGDGLPIILIQTSRPKALVLIERIQEEGGLNAICFNGGYDPFREINYDLGIFQTNNNNLYLFAEFFGDDPNHIEARKKWDQRCKKNNSFCGLIIAKGLKGASRGNPQLKDMMAFFEAKSVNPNKLGMGVLQLMSELDD